MDTALKQLAYIQQHSGKALASGLNEAQLTPFIRHNDDLREAVAQAHQRFTQLQGNSETADLLALDEQDLLLALQHKLLQFYDADTVQPYVPLSAKGAFIVTSHGAVIHDSGGYGMLGLGHNPADLLKALSAPQVMANIMTPSFSQLAISQALDKEIGQRHQKKASPFRYMFLNSGSEGVGLAARLSDLNASKQLNIQLKTTRFLSLKGSFHGRTDRPAIASDSSRLVYQKHLASFQASDNLLTVEANDLDELRQVFSQAEKEGVFIEAMFIEPVMGEGRPGYAITPEFYGLARDLTEAHGSLLIIDSVQAGLRCTGYLSILDYPGFEDIKPPNIEVYSKAVNGGQYPLSIIAADKRVQDLFTTGLYGNTMTANPRALDAAEAMLRCVNPALKEAIVSRGLYFKQALNALQAAFPHVISVVQGTGLLLSIEINPEVASVVGADGLELRLRKRGFNVIHGGKNALRFTPPFTISEAEIDMIIAAVKQLLADY